MPRCWPFMTRAGSCPTRLFSGKSIFVCSRPPCGCAVLNPAVGHVEELFEADREIALFRDGAELAEWVRRLRGNDVQARLMGLKAWERVQGEHLPAHRVATLMTGVEQTVRSARTGVDGRIALWLAPFRLWNAKGCRCRWMRWSGPFWPCLPMRMCWRCCCVLRPGRSGGFYAAGRARGPPGAIRRVPGRQPGREPGRGAAREPDFGPDFFAASSSACRAGHQRARGHAPFHLPCLARELQRLGHDSRPGFVFNPAEHTPESALECLILASEQAPDNSDVYRAMHRLLARSNGWEGLRLKALSYLSLRERNNWRLGLELGVTDCRAFRVRQGLEELLLARDRARALGQGGRFEAALSGLDGSGHIRRLLQHEDHTPANA